jgi:hypothetical protein
MAWTQRGDGNRLADIALTGPATRPVALAYVIGCVTILRPGYLPAMYVIALLPFATLIVAGTADALWRARQCPHGWRDFDYIVSTEAMRGDLARTPITPRRLRTPW